MKRFFFLIVCILFTLNGWGQKYEPTTRWPYLYEHFQKGVIYLKNNRVTEREVNIHLAKSVLHYTEDNVIHELSNIDDVDSIRIEATTSVDIQGDVHRLRTVDTYVYIEDKVYRVLQQDTLSGLYLLSLGNFDDLLTTTGAYGTRSHTSSAKNYNVLDFGGITERNLIKLRSEKEDGKFFPVDKTYYFKIDGQLVKADRKLLEKAITSPQAKERLQQYLKKNKVKWNQPDSLIKLYQSLLLPPQ
jgi:hypothetical protein